MTPENILNAARGVLERRGRCIGAFESADGRVDLAAALAVADGADADMWLFWRELRIEELNACTLALIEAARLLAEVMAPLQPVRAMALDRLVMLLGDSSDISTDEQVYGFLAEAARRAAQTGVAA
jgi:hypothetical protein